MKAGWIAPQTKPYSPYCSSALINLKLSCRFISVSGLVPSVHLRLWEKCACGEELCSLQQIQDQMETLYFTPLSHSLESESELKLILLVCLLLNFIQHIF